MSNNTSEQDSSTILRTVPDKSGFHFNTAKGTYTGLSANSLEDFASKLKSIEEESVSYHYYRGDFQRWMDTTLGDRDFADSMCFLERGLRGNQLREELLKLLDKRITELRGLKWVENEGI